MTSELPKFTFQALSTGIGLLGVPLKPAELPAPPPVQAQAPVTRAQAPIATPQVRLSPRGTQRWDIRQLPIFCLRHLIDLSLVCLFIAAVFVVLELPENVWHAPTRVVFAPLLHNSLTRLLGVFRRPEVLIILYTVFFIYYVFFKAAVGQTVGQFLLKARK